MRFFPNSRTPRILELRAQGKSAREIAEETGVDRTYVQRVVRKHLNRAPRQYRNMTIASVATEDFRWLRNEAIRTGTTVRDLARAMLTDAIQEARDAGT